MAGELPPPDSERPITWPRCILHADMDAFYASVEQRDRPELRGKPVIVGATGPRSVVSAASYEARAFGVKSAMPGFQARKLCPQGIFLPGDMKKYAAESRKIHAIFERYTDLIEPLAFDEAFLDISGSLRLFGGALNIARRIKQEIAAELGLVVSVGIATSKLVAKIACSRGKPDGLLLVAPGEEASFLAPLPTRALFGVGQLAEAWLAKLGIVRLEQLAQVDPRALEAQFGTSAEEIVLRARGLDPRPVFSGRQAKSLGEESTFSQDISDREELRAYLLAQAEAIAKRARRAQVRGTTLTLKLKYGGAPARSKLPTPHHRLFRQMTHQTSLEEASSDGRELFQLACRLLEELAPTEPVRLIGLSLSRLVSAREAPAPKQLGLFETQAAPGPSEAPARRQKNEQLGQTMDQIEAKFGAGSIQRAQAKSEKQSLSDRRKRGEGPGEET